MLTNIIIFIVFCLFVIYFENIVCSELLYPTYQVFPTNGKYSLSGSQSTAHNMFKASLRNKSWSIYFRSLLLVLKEIMAPCECRRHLLMHKLHITARKCCPSKSD